MCNSAGEAENIDRHKHFLNVRMHGIHKIQGGLRLAYCIKHRPVFEN